MPLIAMTREMGSLGKDVASGIAERTQRKVVYQEIIEPIANKMRLRKSHVERFLEGKSGLWERLTTDRTSLSIFTADETFRFLRDGSTGVIRGWGAVHLLKDVPHVIRVRVCAPLDLRIERMMERLATDNREAVENEIAMNEEAHTAITRRHFGVNWRDPEHYDLVLSTERLSVEECVDEVECVMKKKRFQETPESIRLMDNMALEWAVRSALRRDGRTAALNAAVTVSGGSVRLAGLVDTQREAEAAGEVAAMVEGVKDLENDLRPADTFASRYKRA
ncbi:MAG TPA: cytidylate kinase family protein [Usitatibacter sp.]|jgi:cytidylate kinase|nr:cytidylate kinase family protein [Usitatibacter sp.]